MAQTSMNPRGRMIGVIRAYGEYRRTMRELDRLSDRELSDLGISRSDIRTAARGGVFGA